MTRSLSFALAALVISHASATGAQAPEETREPGEPLTAILQTEVPEPAQPAPARSDISRDLPTPWKPRTPTTVKSCCSNNCGITSSGVSAKLASRSLRGVSGGRGRAVEEEE